MVSVRSCSRKLAHPPKSGSKRRILSEKTRSFFLLISIGIDVTPPHRLLLCTTTDAVKRPASAEVKRTDNVVLSRGAMIMVCGVCNENCAGSPTIYAKYCCGQSVVLRSVMFTTVAVSHWSVCAIAIGCTASTTGNIRLLVSSVAPMSGPG